MQHMSKKQNGKPTSKQPQTYLQVERGMYRYKDGKGEITYHERPWIISEKGGPRSVQIFEFDYSCQVFAGFAMSMDAGESPVALPFCGDESVCFFGDLRCWLDESQSAGRIEYLQEEIRVLKELLGKKPRFNDGQRWRLATKGKRLGRKTLDRFASLVTPNTLLAWHQSPNLNALAEPFVRSIRQECLDRMVFFGEASLRRAVVESVAHYNRERIHQPLENRVIQPQVMEFPTMGPVCRRKRLGGLLKYYYRGASG
jgi:hypothetical protein